MSRVAHRIADGKTRSRDVVNDENVNVDFASLLLSPDVQAGLASAGFERPSPIQLKAIPLGRCGLDLIVQAKSGTGKTCVFSVIALEGLDLQSSSTQVLVLAPTREIAVQIDEVIHSIGTAMDGLRCHVFIGGTMVGPDKQNLKKCHIAVGTPGRIKQLIEFELLKTESIRLFILDEADKLLDRKFKEQVNWIYHQLVESKQMLALSATYPEYLAKQLTTYMRDPMFVRLNRKDLALHGIKQYYKVVAGHRLTNKAFETKVEHLLQVLSQVAFNQCLVFSNLQTRAQNLSDMLNFQGWPSTYISGHQEQAHRLSAMNMLKKFQCRILISTDLTARGIDAENVNLIINLDVPFDIKTYFHRIGRAGRFGTQGAAITLASTGQEEVHLRNIKKYCHGKMVPLPDILPSDLVTHNKTPEDLGYTNSASDESDLDSPLGEEEPDTYNDQILSQESQQPDKPSKSYKDRNRQMRTIGTMHSTNGYMQSSSNGLDKNTEHQASTAQKFSARKTVADKGCQVKPNILSGVLGVNSLDFKIPSLSTHRVHRHAGEYWTYEKAKRDLQIFLDPSQALTQTDSVDKVEKVGSSDNKDRAQRKKSNQGEDESKDNLNEADLHVALEAEQTVQVDIAESKAATKLEITKNPIPDDSSLDSHLVTSQTQPAVSKQTSPVTDTPFVDQEHMTDPFVDSPNNITSKYYNGKRNNEKGKDISQKQKSTKPSNRTVGKHHKHVDTPNGDDEKGGQKPAAKVHTRSRPLSVADTLQQLQNKATHGQDNRFQSVSNGTDPVWESYRKYLPPSTKQSHAGTSNKCSHLANSSSSATSGSSSDSSTSGTDSRTDSGTDSSKSDSEDESESEDETESDGCEEDTEEQYEEDYETQLKQGVESMSFSQDAHNTANPNCYWDAATWQGNSDAHYPYGYHTDYSPYTPYAYSGYQQWPYQQVYQEYSMNDYSTWYNSYQY